MSSPSPPPRFQFSLRWMLVVTSVVAVGLALGLNAWAELLATVLYWALPTPLVVAAVYGRGDVRAFSIGALVPLVSALVKGPWGNSPLSLILNAAWLMVTVGICGIVGVGTRRWIEEHGGTDLK